MRKVSLVLLIAVTSVAGAQSTRTGNKKPAALPDSMKFTSGLLSGLKLRSSAVDETPTADTVLLRRVSIITDRLKDAQEALGGDPTMANRNEPTPPSLVGHLQGAVGANLGNTLEAPTPAQLADIENCSV